MKERIHLLKSRRSRYYRSRIFLNCNHRVPVKGMEFIAYSLNGVVYVSE